MRRNRAVVRAAAAGARLAFFGSMDLTHRPPLARPDRGTTLVEAVVAAGLLCVLAASVLPAAGAAARAEQLGRLRARAEVEAASHLERLRALPWFLRPDGTLAADTVSRVSQESFEADGQGLLAAPAGALDADTGGYVDVPVDAGVPAERTEALTRRWDVRTVPGAPHCRVLRVEVARRQALWAGQPMVTAALARASTVICAPGVRP